jgi:hypothetical protein
LVLWMVLQSQGALAPLLADIACSGLSGCERKFLRRRAVEVMAQSACESAARPKVDVSAEFVMVQFERIMLTAASALGAQCGLGRIRRALLDCGEADMARRLCALARARRALAHPDVALADEIAEVLKGAAWMDRREPGCGSSEESLSLEGLCARDGGDVGDVGDVGDGVQQFFTGEAYEEVSVQTDDKDEALQSGSGVVCGNPRRGHWADVVDDDSCAVASGAAVVRAGTKAVDGCSKQGQDELPKEEGAVSMEEGLGDCSTAEDEDEEEEEEVKSETSLMSKRECEEAVGLAVTDECLRSTLMDILLVEVERQSGGFYGVEVELNYTAKGSLEVMGYYKGYGDRSDHAEAQRASVSRFESACKAAGRYDSRSWVVRRH